MFRGNCNVTIKLNTSSTCCNDKAVIKHIFYENNMKFMPAEESRSILC